MNGIQKNMTGDEFLETFRTVGGMSVLCPDGVVNRKWIRIDESPKCSQKHCVYVSFLWDWDGKLMDSDAL